MNSIIIFVKCAYHGRWVSISYLVLIASSVFISMKNNTLAMMLFISDVVKCSDKSK